MSPFLLRWLQSSSIFAYPQHCLTLLLLDNTMINDYSDVTRFDAQNRYCAALSGRRLSPMSVAPKQHLSQHLYLNISIPRFLRQLQRILLG